MEHLNLHFKLRSFNFRLTKDKDTFQVGIDRYDRTNYFFVIFDFEVGYLRIRIITPESGGPKIIYVMENK